MINFEGLAAYFRVFPFYATYNLKANTVIFVGSMNKYKI